MEIAVSGPENGLSVQRSMLEIGKAAEHLVCADIILSGHMAQLAGQGMPYDVIADIVGRLYRIQVKASLRARRVSARYRSERTCYSFGVRRRGKNGSSRLQDHECDIVALVALDIKAVAYLPVRLCGQTVQIYPPGTVLTRCNRRSWGINMDGFPLSEAVKGDAASYTNNRGDIKVVIP